MSGDGQSSGGSRCIDFFTPTWSGRQPVEMGCTNERLSRDARNPERYEHVWLLTANPGEGRKASEQYGAKAGLKYKRM